MTKGATFISKNDFQPTLDFIVFIFNWMESLQCTYGKLEN